MADDPNPTPTRSRAASLSVLQDALRKAEGEAVRRKAQLQSIARILGVHDTAELRSVVADVERRGGLQKLLKAADNPSELQKRLDQATAEVRQLKHGREFDKLVADPQLKLAKGVTSERLMQLIGYQPDSDEFDARAVREKIAALAKTDAYLFTAEGQPAQSQGSGGVTPTWAARGASEQPATPGETLTSAHLRDPAFMLTQFGRDQQGK